MSEGRSGAVGARGELAGGMPWRLLACLLAGAAIAGTAAAPAVTGEPLTLRQAVELAAAHAPEAAVAAAAEREGAAGARLAADAFSPHAAATSNPGYLRGLPLSVVGGVPSIAGVEVRQTLFDPAKGAALAESRAGEAAAHGGSARARREAARAAAELYASCRGDGRELAGAAEREAAAARARQVAEARAGEGRATPLEVRQAHLREAQARLKRLDLEARRDADQAALRRLLGWPDDAPLDLADDPLAALPQPPSAGGLAAARRADPELAALDRELDLRRAAEVHRLLPTVEIGAQYLRLFPASQYEPFYRSFRADDWSLGLALTLPLPLGHQAADGRARQQATLDRLTAEREARDSRLALDVRQAERALAQAAAAVDLAREATEVAAEGLRVTRALAGEGRASDDDVAAREAEVADAAAGEAQAATALAQARAALLALRGELPGLEAESAAPKPPPPA